MGGLSPLALACVAGRVRMARLLARLGALARVYGGGGAALEVPSDEVSCVRIPPLHCDVTAAALKGFGNSGNGGEHDDGGGGDGDDEVHRCNRSSCQCFYHTPPLVVAVVCHGDRLGARLLNAIADGHESRAQPHASARTSRASRRAGGDGSAAAALAAIRGGNIEARRLARAHTTWQLLVVGSAHTPWQLLRVGSDARSLHAAPPSRLQARLARSHTTHQ